MSTSTVDNVTLCYQGIQRDYRNTVIGHIRTNLQKAFPQNYLEKAKRPFLKEWDTVKAAAEERRGTGELEAPLVDDIDVLGINNFFNLFDSYAEQLIPATAGTENDRRKVKKTLLAWMQSIKAIRDPISHPGEADLKFADAFILLDRARRVVSQLGYTDAAERIQRLSDQLAGRPGAPGPVPRLQPLNIAHPYTLLRTHGLIGRQFELNLLNDWIAHPEDFDSARIFALVAIGGMGKSALAWKWFNDVAPEVMSPLAGRMWWSFYVPDATFENFVTWALAYVNVRSNEQVETLPWEREQQLLAALNERPFLLVLDGLERILNAYARTDAAYLQDTDMDDVKEHPPALARYFNYPPEPRKTALPRAGQFLRQLAGVRNSRVLISTRLFPADLDEIAGGKGYRCHTLTGLSDEDALELWQALQDAGSGRMISRQTILPFFHKFGNHPLLIQILARMVARFRSAPGDFDAWKEAHPEFNPFALDLKQVQTHILAFALRDLAPAEWWTLHVIAGFRMPISMETLKQLLLRTRDEHAATKKPFATFGELETCLDTLEDRGLLGWDKPSNCFDLHPIIRGVTWTKLESTKQQDIYEELRAHFEAMPPLDLAKVKCFEDLAPAIELFNTLIGLGRYDDAYSVFRHRLDDALYFRLGAPRFRQELLVDLLPQKLGESYRVTQRPYHALILHALAKGAMFVGKPGDAVSFFRESHDLVASLPEHTAFRESYSDPTSPPLTVQFIGIPCYIHRPSELASLILSELAHAHRLSGHLRDAEWAARSALMLSRAKSSRYEEGAALYRLGLALSVRGQIGEAKAAFQRSLRIWQAENPRSQEGAGQDPGAAGDRTRPAFPDLEGFVHLCLSQQALWAGDLDSARRAADAAADLFAAGDHRHFRNNLIHCARVQGMISLALDDCVDADKHLNHALDEARFCDRIEEGLQALAGLAELHRRRGEHDRARGLLKEVWEPAERGPYPIFHADALNALSEVETDTKNRDAAVEAATKAYHLACGDGEPYAYRWGLVKAYELLNALEAPVPVLAPFDASKYPPMPEIDVNPNDEFAGVSEGSTGRQAELAGTAQHS